MRRLPLAFSAAVVPRVALAPHELNNPVAKPVTVSCSAVAFEEKFLEVLIYQSPCVKSRRHLQNLLPAANASEQLRTLHRAVVIPILVDVRAQCRRRVLQRGRRRYMGPEVEGADGGRYIGRQGVGRGSGEWTGVNLPISSAFIGGEVGGGE